MGSCRSYEKKHVVVSVLAVVCFMNIFSVSWKNVFVFLSLVKGTLQSKFMVLISLLAIIVVLNKDKI